MKIRVVPFSVTRAVTEVGEFGGHASVYGIKDTYETTFDEGCFAVTLKHQGYEIPITKHHDARVGIGMAHATEDKTGLLIDPGRLNVKRSSDAVEVYGGLPHEGELATGYYSQMSHGFDPIVVEKDKKTGDIHFREVRLYEVALVMRNFAANPEANVDKVRSNLEAVRVAIKEDRIEELGALFSRFADSLDAFVIGASPVVVERDKSTDEDDPEGRRSPLVLPEGKILSTIRETEKVFLNLVGPSPDSRRGGGTDFLSSLDAESEIVVNLRQELAAITEDLKAKT